MILSPEPYEATLEQMTRENLVKEALMWYNKYLTLCRENQELSRQLDEWQRNYFLRDS